MPNVNPPVPDVSESVSSLALRIQLSKNHIDTAVGSLGETEGEYKECFRKIDVYFKEHRAWLNAYARSQTLPATPLVFNSVEGVLQQVGFYEVTRPLPKVLQLKRDKELVIIKTVSTKDNWGKKNELRLLAEIEEVKKQQPEAYKQGHRVGDNVRQLRSIRKGAGTFVTYLFRRGPYSTQSSGHIDGKTTPLQIMTKGYIDLRKKVSHARAALRDLKRESGHFGHRIGKTYVRGGGVLRRVLSVKKKDIFEDKGPKAKQKHIGVELEFCSKADRETLSDRLYMENLMPYVTLKTDGSLRISERHDVTHELTILVNENELTGVITKVCKVLRETGGYVNSSCGMHVHLDMRNRPVETCFRRLINSIEILYQMTPSDRRYNRFCLRNAQDMTFRPERGEGRERYWAINPCAYDRHKTLEIRLHSGTLNATKVINWANLLSHIADTVNNEVHYDAEKFITALKVPQVLADHVRKRVNLFQKMAIQQEEEQVKKLYRAESDQSPSCHCAECRRPLALLPTRDTVDWLEEGSDHAEDESESA